MILFTHVRQKIPLEKKSFVRDRPRPAAFSWHRVHPGNARRVDFPIHRPRGEHGDPRWHQPTLGHVASLLLTGAEGDLSIKKGALWWLSVQPDRKERAVLKAVMTPGML